MKNVVYIKHFENGKKYVGVTNDFERRMNQHNNDSKSGSDFFVHKAMRKYTHETEIVFKSDNYSDAIDMEVITILRLKSEGYELYNITEGGEGCPGKIMTEETKKKISEKHKGKKLSKEHIQKLKDRTFTKEWRENMSKAQTGKIQTEEHKDNIRKGMLGFALKNLKGNTYPRREFKRKCKKNGWNFDDFEEEFAKVHTSPNGDKRKNYKYKLKNRAKAHEEI